MLSKVRGRLARVVNVPFVQSAPSHTAQPADARGARGSNLVRFTATKQIDPLALRTSTTSSGCSWVADSARETLGFAGLSCFATHSRFPSGKRWELTSIVTWKEESPSSLHN